MTHRRLTEIERYQIHALLKQGLSHRAIGRALARHHSTISREINRNQGMRGYRPKQAQYKALARQVNKVHYRITLLLWQEVERLLRLEWSPEQISQRLAKERYIQISSVWIYHYVQNDRILGGNLHKHLRCQKQRKKTYGAKDHRGTMQGRKGLDRRPVGANNRSRLGHWEGDTIIGKNHQGAALTLVDRKSRFTLIEPLGRRTAENTRRAIEKSLRQYPQYARSLTLDNGKEFTQHKQIESNLSLSVFFARPYASWERGTNENTNGLIRQYLKKDRSLHDLTQQETRLVMDRLNHRPRKILGYKTPFEVFFKTKTHLTNGVALAN
ncbi:MAG: IS30 family transposase [Cycloclasticus sp.]|nr:IS30 family transposase [Cycloclasticus sp.]MBG96791.1 IS30 family transposase [Cycloclasticus sp.]HAI96345.1 IS30 family transposase [Methylococcaceae bacterium]